MTIIEIILLFSYSEISAKHEPVSSETISIDSMVISILQAWKATEFKKC